MGADGAIIGRALYDGRVDLRDAINRDFRSAVADATSINTATLTRRVIPCLDVTDGRVVKGIEFVNLRDAGDPVELAAFYNEEGADELVFLDITASSDSRKHHDRCCRSAPPIRFSSRSPSAAASAPTADM